MLIGLLKHDKIRCKRHLFEVIAILNEGFKITWNLVLFHECLPIFHRRILECVAPTIRFILS